MIGVAVGGIQIVLHSLINSHDQAREHWHYQKLKETSN
jgi:hypothetical protein